MSPDGPADHETYDLGLLQAPEPPVRRPPVAGRGRALVLLGVVGLAVVVALIAKTVSPQHHSAPRVLPAPVPKPVVQPQPPPPMPAVYRSGVLLVSAAVDLSQPGSSAFTIRTTRPGPDFAVRCPERMSGSAQYVIRVNGHLVLGSSCSAPDPDGTLGRVDGAIDASAGPGSWSALGVRQGRPVTVVVSVTLPSFATTPPPLMSVGLYQAR